jgi:hypothetical protein
MGFLTANSGEVRSEFFNIGFKDGFQIERGSLRLALLDGWRDPTVPSASRRYASPAGVA